MNENERRVPPPMYWVHSTNPLKGTLEAALGGVVLPRVKGRWMNIATGERWVFADPARFANAVILSGFSEAVSEGSYESD